MKNKKCDFWGITSAGELGKRFPSSKLFFVFKKKCIQSAFFPTIFSKVKRLKSKSELVKQYEIGFNTGSYFQMECICKALLSNFKRDIHSQEECINLFYKKKNYHFLIFFISFLIPIELEELIEFSSY